MDNLNRLTVPINGYGLDPLPRADHDLPRRVDMGAARHSHLL